MEKTYNFSPVAIAGLIIAGVVFVLILSFVSIRIFFVDFVYMQGEAMEPQIYNGSIVLINKRINNITVGDIVFYTDNDQENSYRIRSVAEIKSNNEYIVADANGNTDNISKNHIKGEVFGVLW